MIGLTRYAEPQHHHQIAGNTGMLEPPAPGAHARPAAAGARRDRPGRALRSRATHVPLPPRPADASSASSGPTADRRVPSVQLGGDQLGDLDRVEGGALAQVVVGAEQRQPVLDRLVGADPAHVGRVLAGGQQRGRHVGRAPPRARRRAARGPAAG